MDSPYEIIIGLTFFFSTLYKLLYNYCMNNTFRLEFTFHVANVPSFWFLKLFIKIYLRIKRELDWNHKY